MADGGPARRATIARSAAAPSSPPRSCRPQARRDRSELRFPAVVSPINTAEAMHLFLDGQAEAPPQFRYRPLTVDPDAPSASSTRIDLTLLEDPMLERCCREKRREIDHQLTMLATRNTPGFRPASHAALRRGGRAAARRRACHPRRGRAPRRARRRRRSAPARSPMRRGRWSSATGAPTTASTPTVELRDDSSPG